MKKYLLVLPILTMLMFAIGCSSDDDDKGNPVQPQPGNAYVRIGHLSPDAPVVDIWVDGVVVLQDVAYGDFSDYLTLSATGHRVQVSPANQTSPIVIDEAVTLSEGVSYTVAAVGVLASIDMLVAADDRTTIANLAEVRFVHTSPDAPAVDIAVAGGPVLFSDVSFGQASSYTDVPSSTYNLEVRLAGTETVVLTVPDVPLSDDVNYTVFATGLVGDGTLGALPLIDQGTPRLAELRLAHLSPDAPNVDIWLDGHYLMRDVPFSAVGGYFSVPAGSRHLQVTPAGATTPVVIDANATLAEGASYTVAATGLLSSGDLQPLVLADDRTPQASQAKVRFVHTSPDAPAVDIAVTGGPVLFAGVAFREIGNYLTVAPQSYDLEVRLAGTDTVVLPLPGVALATSQNYSVFAVGLAGDGTLVALPVIDS